MSDNLDKLHLTKLKNHFSNFSSITVNDFYDFYKDVYKDISKGTVSWYIHDLKENKYIKNISRGVYVLDQPEQKSKNEYVVLTMDIVKSSNIAYEVFNEALDKKVRNANQAISARFQHNRKLFVSQGDELQILLPFTTDVVRQFILVLSFLFPFKVRYGISIGEISGEIKTNSWDMNGPIFWNARDQLNKLKKCDDYNGLIISEYSQIDRICNRMLGLINISLQNITEKQWEAINYLLMDNNYEYVTEALNISKTSYYDRLAFSDINEILNAFEAIFDLLKIRRTVD